MNVAAYCRVSTDKSDQLNSLETQKKFFEEYCKRNHLRLIEIYADEGLSGTKIKNRKEFLRLLRDAEKGLFEEVLVKDVSRMARNTVDLLQSVRRLKALQIETVFITADMCTLGNSEFVLTLMGAMAQEESSNTSKRVKFGKKENAKKGKVPNMVYGYDKTKGDYFHLSVNPDESRVVKQIFDWYTEGGYGANKIANMLNSRGITTKRSCEWTQNAVSRILKNEIYIGKIINGKEEVSDFLTGSRVEKEESEWMITEKPELAIISDKEFQQAQRIIGQRDRAFKRNKVRQSNKFVFSTLIKCAECGYSFRRMERTYQNTYVWWACSGRNSNGAGSCSNKTKIPEEDLLTAIRMYLSGIFVHKEKIIQNMLTECNRIYKAKEDNEANIKKLQTKLQKLQKTKDKYMQMFIDDLISREELKEKVRTLNEQIEKKDNQLKIVSFNMDKGDRIEKILEDTFSNMQAFLSMEETTNSQLKKVINRILVQKDGTIDIYLNLFHDTGIRAEKAMKDTDEIFGDVLEISSENMERCRHKTDM